MEGFFEIGQSLELIEVQELLLKRYANIDYILGLSFNEGYELIVMAFEKQTEELLWQRWLVDYPKMTKDTFISFNDYKEEALGSAIRVQTYVSKEKLLAEADEILKKVATKGGADSGDI